MSLSIYDYLLRDTLKLGEKRTDRTGTGTTSLWAPSPLRFSLADGRVPLITSKAVPWKMATKELLWMLSGSTMVKDLKHPGMAAIWQNWANESGWVGPTYGAQWRHAGAYTAGRESGGYNYRSDEGGTDQLLDVTKLLYDSPDTRRAVISLWGADELEAMGITPCAITFQFSRRGEHYEELHLQVYQRSADMMLGVPFDLFQYGLLTHLVARELQLQGQDVHARSLTWVGGDIHVYDNQLDAAEKQLTQAIHAESLNARVTIDPYPTLSILNDTLEAGHISVTSYNPEPAIDAGTPAV